MTIRFTHFPPIIALVLAGLLVGGGYQWGRLASRSAASMPPASGSQAASSSRQPEGIDLSVFWEAWTKAHQSFVGKIDDAKLVEGAITGMVDALDDPYTAYLDPKAAKELNEGLQGSFSGIGAEIQVKNHQLLIVAPLPDSPAAKAGLKPQDQIQQIDETVVDDLTFVEAIRLIRGKDGSKVRLTIMRDNFAEPKEFIVTRGQIEVKSVKSEIRSDKLGYIQVSAFHEDTTRLVSEALSRFTAANVPGVVLDLRANPGGLLDSGIEVASLFLDTGVVVKQKDKDEKVTSFSVRGTAKMPKTPLVVLVDKGSASASEIVAGALQDHGRAKLIGEQTFGKGSVQELENLQNEGQLKVTIAKWLTPKDREINGTGITPDIVVEDTRTEDGKNDTQLDRAVKELSE